MTVTFSTIINMVLFNGVAILLLKYVIANSEIVLKIGVRVVMLLMVMILLRQFIPFELPSQNIINITRIWPKIYIAFVKPVFAFAGTEWSPFSIMLIVSIMGSILSIVKLFISYISLRYTVNNFEPVNDSTVNRIVDEINSEYRKKVYFKVVKSNQVKSPFIFGLCRPFIILPEMNLSEDEWHYVMRHEMSHYYFKDLWIRFACEILQSLYWWNPFAYLLRKQMTKIQELRVDSTVIEKLGKLQKMEYLECLIKVARQRSDARRKRWVASFNSDCEENVTNRIDAIFEYTKEHKIRNSHIFKRVGFILALVIFLTPNFIIFEPYAIAKEHEEGTYEIKNTNSYLIQNDDGTYDVYVDNIHIATVTEVFDESLKIYNKEGSETK